MEILEIKDLEILAKEIELQKNETNKPEVFNNMLNQQEEKPQESDSLNNLQTEIQNDTEKKVVLARI